MEAKIAQHRKYLQKECRVCGKVFRVRTDHNKETCCYAHTLVLQGKLLYIPCPICGEYFVKSSRKKSCSPKCGIKLRASKQRKRILIECEWCSKEVNRIPFEIKKQMHHFCGSKCRIAWQKRENHPKWNGGETTMNGGYVYVNIGNNRYKSRARIIMEKTIKRTLSADELVHHKNHKKNDDRIENLKLVTRKTHPTEHACSC